MSSLQIAYDQITKDLKKKTKLICVSKTKPANLIEELYHYHHYDFGENKVQELLEKSQQLKSLEKLRWHFIGSLQSNKINQLLLVKNLVSIHSIDRMSLLKKLLEKKSSQQIGLFLQVNTSGELEKSGFTNHEEIKTAIELIKDQDHFFFQGFMTIGRIRTEEFEQDARSCFAKLKELKVNYPLAELSMGMSADYKIAEDYDTDWIRVGSKIFASRS